MLAASLLLVVAIAAALLDAGCRFARGAGAAKLLAGAVAGASVLLLVLQALALLGTLTSGAIWTAVAAFWVVARGTGPRPGALPALRRLLVAARRDLVVAGAVTFTAILAGAAIVRPWFEYDAASYHLPYTADALDRARLPDADTPFGDPAGAYQPKNAELLRVVLAPLRDERLWFGASIVQVPLLLLSVYVAARAGGSRRRAAALGAASILLSPLVREHALGAMVDLDFAGWFTAFVALALRGQPLAAGLACGLACGTKYLAVPFAPLLLGFVVVLVARARRRREPPAESTTLGSDPVVADSRGRVLGWFAAGALATGAFFYVRNLVLTGNPIMPLCTVLTDGPYGLEQLRGWVYDVVAIWGVRAAAFETVLPSFTTRVPGTLIEQLGLLVAPALCWVAGAVASVRRQAMLRVVVLAVPAVVAVALFLVPYASKRFALAAVPLLGVVVAAGAGSRLGAVVVGAALLAQHALGFGLVSITSALLVVSVASGQVCRRWPWFAAACWVALPFAATLRGAPERYAFPLGPERQPGYDVAARLAGGGPIAYAGTNLVYLLRGTGRHPVVHVPPDGRSELRLHDRAKAWRAAGLPAPNLPEPNLQYRVQDAAAWLAALRRERVEWLFVQRLQRHQLLAVRHDARGFPIEAAWAHAFAPLFEPVHEDAAVAVFRFRGELAPAPDGPARVEQDEPDALALLARPDDLRRRYPLAAQELTDPRYRCVLERVRGR